MRNALIVHIAIDSKLEKKKKKEDKGIDVIDTLLGILRLRIIPIQHVIESAQNQHLLI